MHELSIMQSALDLACEQAAAAGAFQIHAITLRVGVLSGVVPDALAFAFEVARSGTRAASATLHIEHVPADALCDTCGASFSTTDLTPLCPHCGAFVSTFITGRELELVALEIS